jgi:hypothetical protein
MRRVFLLGLVVLLAGALFSQGTEQAFARTITGSAGTNTVTVSPTSDVIYEGQTVTYTVTGTALTGAGFLNVTGEATLGDDYTITQGGATIASLPHVISFSGNAVSFDITAVDDGVEEGGERFLVGVFETTNGEGFDIRFTIRDKPLVSNIDQSDGGTGGLQFDHGQAFTTGSNPEGYTLTSVDMQFSNLADSAVFSTGVTAKIHSQSGGTVGAVLGTLTNPSDQTFTTDTVLTFTAPPGGIDLEADTTYYFLLDVTGDITGKTSSDGMRNTASDDEDAAGESDWSIADRSIYRTSTDPTNTWSNFSESKKLRINGHPRQPTLIANIGQPDDTAGSANHDHAQAFTTGPSRSGYTLTGVDAQLTALSDSDTFENLVVTIRSDSSGLPGTVLDTLTNPPFGATSGDETFTFAASAGGIELAANTRYWVMFDMIAATTDSNLIRETGSDAEDAGGEDGFSIADDSRHREHTVQPGGWNPHTRSKKIDVQGVANANPVECVTANADGAYLVPGDWPLNPANSSPGDKFRLLFQTSTKEPRPTQTGIAHYNTFVQNAVKAGHEYIGDSCGDLFKVVGSTSAVDARDNAETTGTGVPIHWLGGEKLADDYADFYDGNWDSYDVRDESGGASTSGDTWTGSNSDGTKHSTNYLGAGTVEVGAAERFDSPLSSYGESAALQENPYYGISPLFVVGPPAVSISIEDGHTTIREGGTRTVVFTIDSPAPWVLRQMRAGRRLRL